jgi:hypothetical protein
MFGNNIFDVQCTNHKDETPFYKLTGIRDYFRFAGFWTSCRVLQLDTEIIAAKKINKKKSQNFVAK